MPYTNVWSDTTPTGSEAANTLDDIIRSLKIDIEQRFVDIFAMPNFTDDPLRPYGLKFTDSQNAVISMGDNAGTPRSILIKNKAGSTTYFTFTSTELTAVALTSTGVITANNGLTVTATGPSNFSSKVTIKDIFEPLNLVAAASGTYGRATYIQWFRNGGTTERVLLGYTGDDVQTFSIRLAETGGIFELRTGNAVLALTVGSDQKATFSGYVYINVSGMTKPVIIGPDSTAGTNGIISFNNNTALTTLGGIYGGAASGLNYNDSASHKFRISGTQCVEITSTTLSSTGTISGDVVYAEKTSAHGSVRTIGNQAGSLIDIVNSKTFTLTIAGGQLIFSVYFTLTGVSCLFSATYDSATVTNITPLPTGLALTATPGATELGISKSAGSFNLLLKSGSGLAAAAGQLSIQVIGNTVTVTDWA